MTIEGQMSFIGVIRELQPSIQDLPPYPRGGRTLEVKRRLQRGTLYWAGDDFLRPGLYVWTGEANVLVESRENILTKMEVAIVDPNGPGVRKEE